LGEVYRPQPALISWHEKRFAAFENLQAAARSIR
jgi:D-ribulokinase